jgi:hypothetical protein
MWTLFPYTTLFRSCCCGSENGEGSTGCREGCEGAGGVAREDGDNLRGTSGTFLGFRPAYRNPVIPPRPKPHPFPLSVSVTLLNMTLSIPTGDRPIIPARFRVFPNYDLSNPWIGGKVVQPGLQRALMYQNSHRGFLTMIIHTTDDNLWPGSRETCPATQGAIIP